MTPRRSSSHPVSPADARADLSKSKAWLEASMENLEARRWAVGLARRLADRASVVVERQRP